MGVKELVESLNQSEVSPVPSAMIDTLFDALWIKLEEKISDIDKAADKSRKSRSQHEILEELVVNTRGFDIRFREMQETIYTNVSRNKTFPEEVAISEMLRSIIDGPVDIFGLVLIAGSFQASAPWLSSALMGIYSDLKNGNAKTAELKKIIEVIESRAMFRVVRGLGKEADFMIHVLKNILLANLEEDINLEKRRPSLSDEARRDLIRRSAILRSERKGGEIKSE